MWLHEQARHTDRWIEPGKIERIYAREESRSDGAAASRRPGLSERLNDARRLPRRARQIKPCAISQVLQRSRQLSSWYGHALKPGSFPAVFIQGCGNEIASAVTRQLQEAVLKVDVALEHTGKLRGDRGDVMVPYASG
jgi:hypothetical protein